MVPPPHLYGVAVDGLAAAAHVHHLSDLQDVVWHVAAGAAAIGHLPPLLPVIQDLSERSSSLRNPAHCGRWRGVGAGGLTSTTSSFSTDSSVLFLATKSYLDVAKSCDWPRPAVKLLEEQGRSEIHPNTPPTSADPPWRRSAPMSTGQSDQETFKAHRLDEIKGGGV